MLFQFKHAQTKIKERIFLINKMVLMKLLKINGPQYQLP
jgi:hypothetical protein